MIVGNPLLFAVESRITQAYERLSYRALGFFVIHILGHRYGVCTDHATMLACSFEEVALRIAQRGSHTVPFVESGAGEIADAYLSAVYSDQPLASYLGIPTEEFERLVHSHHIVWAPDGDSAFDDGSFVFQFDVDERVRLVGFNRGKSQAHDPHTLVDVWIPAEDFYYILKQWHKAFESEWKRSAKI